MLSTDRGSLFDILTEVNLKMTDIIKMLFIHYMYIQIHFVHVYKCSRYLFIQLAFPAICVNEKLINNHGEVEEADDYTSLTVNYDLVFE